MSKTFAHWKTLAKTWKQKFYKAEAERKKLTEELSAERNKVRHAEMRMADLERDLNEAKVEAANMHKTIEALNLKHSSLEVEKEKFQSMVKSSIAQTLKDQMQEVAEEVLQCAVCHGVFMDATTINCGHSFCNLCIHEWQKQKSNCPLCRTDIEIIVASKTLDQVVDKIVGRPITTATNPDILKILAVILRHVYEFKSESELNDIQNVIIIGVFIIAAVEKLLLFWFFVRAFLLA